MKLRDHLQARHLLDQARRLAGAGSQPGRPRQVDLRRAVSAAYYSVYHDISLRSASHVVGYGAAAIDAPSDAALHLVRWYSHGGLALAARLTEDLQSASVDPGWKPGRRAAWEVLHDRNPGQLPPSLVLVTRRVRDLQEQRHSADYDHVESVSRAQALGAVAEADAVLQHLAANAATDPYAGFFILVALCNRSLPPGI